MEIVYKNLETHKPNIHYCDVCGFGFFWTEESSYYERGVGHGYSGHEIQFVICSNECRESPELEKLLDIFGTRTS